MSEGNPHPEEPRHPAVHYEPTDLSFRGVIAFYAGLALSLVIVGGGSWWLVLFFQGREAELKRSKSPWAMEEKSTSHESAREETGGEQSRLPSLPRLEGIGASRTIQEQYQQEEERLRSYGWVDRKAGVVHIPIEEAIEKLSGRLPARDGKEIDEFSAAPSAASSGRVPRGGE